MTGLSDTFRSAWRALRSAPLLVLAGAFALVLADLVTAIANGLLQESTVADARETSAADGMITAASALVLLYAIRLLFRAWLRPGYLRIHHAAAHDQPTRARTLISLDRFGTYAVALILVDLLPALAALTGALPGALVLGLGGALDADPLSFAGLLLAIALGAAAYLYVYLGVILLDWTAALGAAPAVTELRRAWQLARGHRLRIFVLVLASAALQLLSLLGVILVFVGVALTWTAARAYTDALFTRLYVDLTRA